MNDEVKSRSTMRALVKYAAGPGHMEVREVPQPSPGPGEVRLRVHMTGICGSDLHIHDDDIQIPVRPPVVTGHELVATVDALGDGVTGWSAGDRVVTETAYTYCGSCVACQSGRYNLCPERRTLGYWYDGAFAPYTVVPAGRLHRVPDGIPDRAAVLTEPLACTVHAVYELARLTPGDRVVVVGPGPIGLLAQQLAQSAGTRVLVLGTSADRDRLALARDLGADGTVNVQEEDSEAAVRGWAGPEGADVVFECSGSQGGTELGLHVARRMGQFVQIGLHGTPIAVDFSRIAYRELAVTGSLGSTHSAWLRSLDLLRSGALALEPLVSDVLPLDRWHDGFEQVRQKEGIKFVLRPEA